MPDMKSTMVKKVNVHAPIPIRTVSPTLYGDYKGLMMSPANIMKCLIHRAAVTEVLSDGTLVKLDRSNYNKDNSDLMATKKIEVEELNTVGNDSDSDNNTIIEVNDCIEVKDSFSADCNVSAEEVDLTNTEQSSDKNLMDMESTHFTNEVFDAVAETVNEETEDVLGEEVPNADEELTGEVNQEIRHQNNNKYRNNKKRR